MHPTIEEYWTFNLSQQQYEGLEKLYEKYKDQGLVILGFPCNQFGGQEPGTAEEIQNVRILYLALLLESYDWLSLHSSARMNTLV